MQNLVNILSICNITLNVAIRSQVRATAYGLHLLTKDHEDFKKMAMNQSFPRTQELIQSVQRQSETLSDRTYEYNIFVGQESRC